MHFQVMRVTPEMASEWLANNGKNRRFSKAHSDKIANSIKNGEWVLNGETICFDEGGRLLDGQHRLNAIADSGIPVQVSIVTGISDPSAFETYDSTQKTRGADQIAEMKGVENSRRVTAAARVILAWEKSKTVAEFHKWIMCTPFFSPHVLSDKAAEVEGEVSAVHEMFGSALLSKSRVGAGILGMLVILNRIDPVNTQAFLTKVRTGVVDQEKDPALVFRDRLLSGSGTTRNERRWRVAAMAMTVKAWNYHKRGGELKSIRFRQEGDTPESFPVPVGGGKK